MKELLDKAYGLIVLYTPMILTVISTFINFVILFRKLKSIKIKDEINNAITNTNTEINELTEQVKLVVQENDALRRRTGILIEALSRVEVKDEDFVHKKM